MKRASTTNSAATTLVPSTSGEVAGLAPCPKFTPNGGVEDYSDVEVDVTTAAAKMAIEEKEKEKGRNSPGWNPGFMKKDEKEVQRRASLKGKEPERDHEDGSVGSNVPPRFTESPTRSRATLLPPLHVDQSNPLDKRYAWLLRRPIPYP
ncbi:hypothetical protein FRC01_011923 [Tulasnella sp. 417]|nr:hypothetical protein FRC01_011923 [Tulasnella sp. 417]